MKGMTDAFRQERGIFDEKAEKGKDRFRLGPPERRGRYLTDWAQGGGSRYGRRGGRGQEDLRLCKRGGGDPPWARAESSPAQLRREKKGDETLSHLESRDVGQERFDP